MKTFLSARPSSLLLASSIIALFYNQALAGIEEESRTKLEASHFSSLRTHILGKKEMSSPDQIFKRISYLDSLKLRSKQRKQQEALDMENRRLIALPADTVMHQFAFLNGPSLVHASCTNHTFANYARDPELRKQIKANNEKEALERVFSLIGPFVTIPEGYLPQTVQGDFVQDGLFIKSFESSPYPVTRELWMEVMKKIPEAVPENERATWADCKKCPVNHVIYENSDFSPADVQEFLKKLNEKTQASKCTYDLPDDNQLWYSIRGDETGQNEDPISQGVTYANVDEYVTYMGNSGGKIQPVGRKNASGEYVIKKNKFGIELGNVWKMSKSIYNPAHPGWGRSARGGSWRTSARVARSVQPIVAGVGEANDNVGFSLLRTCH